MYLLRHRLTQQRAETCLLEVSVGGERHGEAAVLHHDEGDAICQAPILVKPAISQVDCPLEQVGVHCDDLEHRIGERGLEIDANQVPILCERVTHFRQYSRSGNPPPTLTSDAQRPVESGRVVRVIVSQESDDVASVHEHIGHIRVGLIVVGEGSVGVFAGRGDVKTRPRKGESDQQAVILCQPDELVHIGSGPFLDRAWVFGDEPAQFLHHCPLWVVGIKDFEIRQVHGSSRRPLSPTHLIGRHGGSLLSPGVIVTSTSSTGGRSTAARAASSRKVSPSHPV
jgi:hypothetical protein